MSETKHTPGPWTIEETPRQHYAAWIESIAGGDLPTVARIEACDSQRDGSRDYEMEMANARLIAAAPEMLEELKATQEMAASYLGNDRLTYEQAIRALEIIERGARAAIAKAEGRE